MNFHRGIELKFCEGTTLEVTFQDGIIKRYDMARLFDKYPQLSTLKNRRLFKSGKLHSSYGVIWNDELDVDIETIYEYGETVGRKELPINIKVGYAVMDARTRADLSQQQLSAATGIDQGDISKIERGLANPSINTLNRIANALGMDILITFERKGTDNL